MFEKLFGSKKEDKVKPVEVTDSMKVDLKLIAMSNKIEAIKLYRNMTDCGLKEAKDFIESL
ncbi:MAG TPA: hypothetical protein ENK21_00190 [Trueperaceae bacterium]|nr:hypothetical protein [Trueperaceae bacterium]